MTLTFHLFIINERPFILFKMSVNGPKVVFQVSGFFGTPCSKMFWDSPTHDLDKPVYLMFSWTPCSLHPLGL